MNTWLPADLRVEKPAGHSGRRTFTSVALEEGVPAEIVAKCTKHKNVDTVMMYHKEKNKTLITPALAIAASMRQKSRNFVAGVDVRSPSDNDGSPPSAENVACLLQQSQKFCEDEEQFRRWQSRQNSSSSSCCSNPAATSRRQSRSDLESLLQSIPFQEHNQRGSGIVIHTFHVHNHYGSKDAPIEI